MKSIENIIAIAFLHLNYSLTYINTYKWNNQLFSSTYTLLIILLIVYRRNNRKEFSTGSNSINGEN